MANDTTERSSMEQLPMPRRPQHMPTIFQTETEPPARASRPTSQIMKCRNIVIFGDSGVGKSSLINMLAGCKIAKTSNGVLGCTFQSNHYPVSIDGEVVNLWDTAGLDEGTRGRVPHETAEKNLSKLLRDLRSASGVHLLVYCIRGPSVKKSLARNYVVFYSAICRKKVPIVAVVTGLENEPRAMGDWWTKGESELAKYKMRFHDHACVTTIDMGKFKGTAFEDRSMESQRSVYKLIADNCHRTATRPPADTNVLIKAALQDFRSVMRFGWENVQSSCCVVFYQTDISLFHPGIFGDLKKIHSQMNGRSFVFHNVGDFSRNYVTPKILKGGVDLLIFAGTMSERNMEEFQHFYTFCSGEVCPVLVITDHDSVNPWQEHVDSMGIGAHVLASLSPDGKSSVDVHAEVDELCLVRGPAKNRGTNRFLNLLRGRPRDNVADGAMVPHSLEG